jgi:uncharacterized membrane protein YdcZ (DUF606 family)
MPLYKDNPGWIFQITWWKICGGFCGGSSITEREKAVKYAFWTV